MNTQVNFKGKKITIKIQPKAGASKEGGGRGAAKGGRGAAGKAGRGRGGGRGGGTCR